MIFNQVEMEDIKLVKLYNRGERDFSNKELYTIYSRNYKRRSVKIGTPNFSNKMLESIEYRYMGRESR
jgi:hypothetical protein